VARLLRLLGILILTVVAFAGGYVFSRSLKPDLPYEPPTYILDGSVLVPAFELPPSEMMSEESKALLKLRALAPAMAPDAEEDIAETRKGLVSTLAPFVWAMQERYPVDVVDGVIADVPVRVFTPRDQEGEPGRVLINLHGGAFAMCWESCSILESTPIA